MKWDQAVWLEEGLDLGWGLGENSDFINTVEETWDGNDIDNSEEPLKLDIQNF